MTTPDLKSAAFEFTRKHGCPPASLVLAAMEIGAALMAVEAAQFLREQR